MKHSALKNTAMNRVIVNMALLLLEGFWVPVILGLNQFLRFLSRILCTNVCVCGCACVFKSGEDERLDGI